ncbi:MAG: Neelaredoxin [Chloroflexi bacterium]|nr:Neelaredoxin [Chloroflexota bacterium]
MNFSDLVQTADWKKEKHVPAIDAPDTVQAGQPFMVSVSVGKEIPHPNTTEHHIAWIDVYFKPAGDAFTYQVGHFDFRGHGESAKGANKGPVYTDPGVTFSMKVDKPGTLVAMSLCNVHGLWQDSKPLALAIA